MIRQSWNSITLMFRYAAREATCQFLILLISAIATPVSILLIQRLIDGIGHYITGDADLTALLSYLILFILISILTASTGWLNSWADILLNRALLKRFTPTIIEKFKKIDYSCFEAPEMHNTIYRMSENCHEKIKNIFVHSVNLIFFSQTLAGTAVIFIHASAWFTLGFIFIIVPMMWINYRSTDMMNTLLNNQSMEERKLRYLERLLTNKDSLYDLKIYQAIDFIISTWRKKTKVVLSERMNATMRSQKLYMASNVLLVAWILFVIIVLVRMLYSHAITAGLFVALFGAMDKCLLLSDQLSSSFTRLSQASLEMVHYRKFMDMPETNRRIHGHEVSGHCIEFHDVMFTYPGDNRPVLRGLSFQIRSNENVAIVGENGAGKSTVIKLLCNLYQPDKGRITIDGLDLNQLSTDGIQKVISVVFQDFAPYSLTLRENIAFGDLRKLHCDEELIDALKQGLALEVLEQAGGNLDAPLGKLEENGIDLSGGQWQRVAIARACASNAPFILLDEATAALDPVAESRMYEAFLRVMKKKGSIMVSHRMASARLADKIIVLSDGCASETGTHEELVQRDTLYSRMFKTQSAWYKDKGPYDN